MIFMKRSLPSSASNSLAIAGIFFLISVYFVWRSFHKMRIGAES